MQVESSSTKTKINRDVIVQLSSSSPAMRLRPSGRRQTPSASPTSLNCSFSHFSSARRSFSSATRHSACLLARRDVRSCSCLMPRRPFLASVAQGRHNDCFNGRRLALESPRRSVILSTAPNITLHVTPKFQPPADSTDRETRLVQL